MVSLQNVTNVKEKKKERRKERKKENELNWSGRKKWKRLKQKLVNNKPSCQYYVNSPIVFHTTSLCSKSKYMFPNQCISFIIIFTTTSSGSRTRSSFVLKHGHNSYISYCICTYQYVSYYYYYYYLMYFILYLNRPILWDE